MFEFTDDANFVVCFGYERVKFKITTDEPRAYNVIPLNMYKQNLLMSAETSRL